jgi:predicted GNAT family N-acyltransferase
MSDVTISLVSWSDRQADLISVRRPVFIEEQNVPEEIEIDDTDPECYHVLACDRSGKPVGTARLDEKGKIGRMAVLREYRGMGIGAAMLEAIMDCGRARGITDFHLSAQITAIGFYRKMGFEPYGEEFLEAGIRHINMSRTPDKKHGTVS